ncbi:MAG: hypothetical protein WC415_05860 [Patescibacteria group bacterium]|jgi:hypothetical protein
MISIKKDLKFYLISFLLVIFLSVLPELFLYISPYDFRIDFMYELYYYLVFFVLFFISLLLFFFGLGKGKIVARKTFLIYYSLLFLITIYLVATWLGSIVDKLVPAFNFL